MANDQSEQPSPPPRSRLEDEVREILVRSERNTPLSDRVRRTARRPRLRLVQPPRQRSTWTARIGPGSLWLGSIAVAILASAVRDSSQLLATLLALISVGLFVSLYIRRPGDPMSTKYWRGQPLDLRPKSSNWLDQLRDRFRRPPRI